MAGVKSAIRDARAAHGEGGAALSRLFRELDGVRENGHLSPEGRRSRIVPLRESTEAALERIDRAANSELRRAGELLKLERQKVAAARRGEGEDPAKALLREQRLGRHLQTLRGRIASGALSANELRALIQEALDGGDEVFLDAAREILPELRGASRGLDPQAVVETEGLNRADEMLKAAAEAAKTPEQRALEAAAAEYETAAREILTERQARAFQLGSAYVNEPYFAGESETRLADLVIAGRLSAMGRRPTYLDLEGEPRVAGDPLDWNNIYAARDAAAAAA